MYCFDDVDYFGCGDILKFDYFEYGCIMVQIGNDLVDLIYVFCIVNDNQCVVGFCCID